MRRIDRLNGLKSWWNKNAKSQYKTDLTADELKSNCFHEFECSGTVLMLAFYSKDNKPHEFLGRY